MALGKVWEKVVKEIGKPKETRTRGVANTLRDDEINSILALMQFFGCSDRVISQTVQDLKLIRYRVFDWLGMMIQNEGYEDGNDTCVKVLAHVYIKSDGDIDKFIKIIREEDFQVDRSWEEIDLEEK